ncbi:insulinase family protein [Pseudidiomarina sp. 1APP75-27a]|uniref:M16 family metallopeptidase n=1 Tax=Pseudidiomarina terrestris TaxID=2820060 RepID=UPI00264AAF05|nr:MULTISPECIES: pitrilysin family protein [unclassified Pseudidiomarina]MDN7139006.1 insulinase family protein [Pseudidiomarina sp. 1ASP75-14]MEA3586769.1 insulinase family protein [Pseudidiomarina sp. 1APP75-27a]
MRLSKTLTAMAVATVLLGGCQATAQQASANNAVTAQQQQNLPDVDISYETFTLDNGLTVVVHEDRKAPIVAVNVWYGVGSKDESEGQTGFAHLFEHLMFNGTENYDDEYFGPFERAGATDMNGTTNSDRTNYFQNVPTPALDMALWMESDRMGHLLGAVTQEKLDEQRGVVQNEKRQGEAQPYGRVFGFLAEQTFPEGHPYSWSVIGSMEDLNAASLDDVHQWFNDYYGAANAVVVLAGDIDVETAKQKMNKYFGDIEAGKPLKKLNSWVAKREGTKRATMEDNVPAARLYKLWNTAEMGTADSDYLGLLVDILASGKNSRLYQRLVYDEQIASMVSGFNYERVLAGQFFIIADAKPGVDMDRIEAIIDEEVAKIIAEGPTAEELERTKFSTVAGFVRGAERIGGFGGKSDILAAGEVYHGDPGYYEQSMEHLKAATPAKVQAAAERWLSDGAFVLNVVPQPNYTTIAAQADRSELPEVGELPQLELPELTTFTLSNGLEVALAERHDVPTVQMRLVIDSGYASDFGGKVGTASYTMSMLREGTTSRDSLELSKELESLGTNLYASASLDNSTVSMDTLVTSLVPSLDIMADVLMNPAFSEEEIERKRGLWIESIKKEKAQPTSQAFRVLPQLIFGDNHAYSVPFTGSGTEASINSLTRADLVEHAETWLRPDISRLVIVGATTEAEIKPLLEQYLGEWTSPATAAPEKQFTAVEPQQEARVYLIDQPGTPQSTIIAGHLAPSSNADNAEAIDVMNTILGGSFTSRLNMNLREDKGWSYGARSSWYAADEAGMMLATAPVQTDKTKESIQEILKEFEGYLGGNPATDEELEKVISNKTAKLPGAYETKAALLGSIVNTLEKGKDMTWLENYGQRIRSLEVETIRGTADDVLRPNALTWVIIGDLSLIEDEVRSLNLGTVTKLDSNGNPL